MRTQQKRCRFGIPQVALSAATLSAILAVQPCAAASQADVRISSPTRLTGPPTEDDYPAAAMAPDGTLWLVYVEYQRGSPIDMKAVRARSFDSLVPRGNGDRIRLMRFDGSNWSRPLDVTDAGLDVWRPTVAITGRGDVLVAWAQNLGGDWEICCRVFTPTSGKKPSRTDEPPRGLWSRVVRVTRSAGSDFHVVAATDADGKVWLAWQSWRGNNFDILVASRCTAAPREYHDPRWADPQDESK
ncbi:MAG: hypothetical protein GXP27_21515 [Planctomycetes bacterium]|nr:hypothetical protein [Planctomycetota bacterium]